MTNIILRPNQVIQSLLDTDLYKFTMMQVVYHQFPGADVEYHFRCRTKGVDLIPYMAEIEEEIAAYCELRFTDQELDTLGKLRFIKKDFVHFLRMFKADMRHVKVVRSDSEPGAIDIVLNGPWLFTIMFEVPILAIVQEVYWRNNVDVDETMRKGKEILIEKMKTAETHAEFNDFRFADFGTRRRFSRQWHEQVIDTLKGSMPIQLAASSNVLLADRYQLTAMGTMAHEYLQACQALGPRLKDSQKFAFDMWAKEYRGDLGIALTDVIGMDQFLNDFDLFFCKLYDGMRHDSGNPYEWGEKAIAHYQSNRIDPMTKALVFSDGLDLQKAMDLQAHFKGRARTQFGIGTSLTNDMGFPALNNVLKMTHCNGQPVAKRSDSPGKSMCTDPHYERALARAFGIQVDTPQ
jgi:nicotinate phosphoribosyltransferase